MPPEGYGERMKNNLLFHTILAAVVAFLCLTDISTQPSYRLRLLNHWDNPEKGSPVKTCENRDDLNIPMQALQCIAASPAWGFFMRLQKMTI